MASQSPPASGFAANFVTALAFAPDGRLFYTERAGTVKVWQNGAAKTFATVPVASDGERGLLGLAISPTFSSDRYVYAFYSDPNRTQQHVIRWRDCAGVGTGATVLVTLPSGSDCCHKGGRLAFGHDGMLYVTLGEEHTAGAAQNTSDPRGKVLRYRPDGGIPADNPFGPTDPVWAYGLRNPFGIAVSAGGQIAVTSNGPSGDAGSPGTGYDTLMLSVTRGGGYQWPLCYGYSHPLAGPAGCGGRTAPDWSSESGTVVPTGAAFIDSSAPAAVRGPPGVLHLRRRHAHRHAGQPARHRHQRPVAVQAGRGGGPGPRAVHVRHRPRVSPRLTRARKHATRRCQGRACVKSAMMGSVPTRIVIAVRPFPP